MEKPKTNDSFEDQLWLCELGFKDKKPGRFTKMQGPVLLMADYVLPGQPVKVSRSCPPKFKFRGYDTIPKSWFPQSSKELRDLILQLCNHVPMFKQDEEVIVKATGKKAKIVAIIPQSFGFAPGYKITELGLGSSIRPLDECPLVAEIELQKIQ